MPTVISPSINLSGPQGAASGARGRSAEQPESRSFGAALDRSRAASAAGTQETTEASGTESLTGRKTRGGEKKTELSAEDVMALLAPLSAPIVPTAPVQGKLAAGQASKGGADAASLDGLAAGSASVALPEDATAGAEGPAKAATGHDAPKAAAADAAQDTQAGKAPADQADNAALPLADAAVATSSDTSASASATVPVPAAGVAQPANAKAAAAKPASASDSVAAATDKPPATPLAGAAVESARTDAPVMQADTASAEPASEPMPQALQALQANAALVANRTAEAATPARGLTVAPEVGSSEWGPAIGRQMIRMGANGQQVAELNLNPANLGPLKVTLTMGDNQAQAMFVSAHEAVRKAVEAALPQLRTTLAEQGISLGQTSVGAETRQPNSGGNAFAEQNPQRPQGQPGYPGSGRTDAADTRPAGAPVASAVRRATAGLDTFA